MCIVGGLYEHSFSSHYFPFRDRAPVNAIEQLMLQTWKLMVSEMNMNDGDSNVKEDDIIECDWWVNLRSGAVSHQW